MGWRGSNGDWRSAQSSWSLEAEQLTVALGFAYSGLHLAEIRRILSPSAVSEERSELTCVSASASLFIVGGARHRRTTSELVSSSLSAFASCRVVSPRCSKLSKLTRRFMSSPPAKWLVDSYQVVGDSCVSRVLASWCGLGGQPIDLLLAVLTISPREVSLEYGGEAASSCDTEQSVSEWEWHTVATSPTRRLS